MAVGKQTFQSTSRIDTNLATLQMMRRGADVRWFAGLQRINTFGMSLCHLPLYQITASIVASNGSSR